MRKKNNLQILYTAFIGKTNTSKILLDHINSLNKLYLKNSYSNSFLALKKALEHQKFDLVVAFGQRHLERDVIQIERVAKGEETSLVTTYDYDILVTKLKKKYKVVISDDAGEYLCNYLYFCSLKFLRENNYKTKMIFIHIPKVKNITDVTDLAAIINGHFEEKNEKVN